MAQKVKVQCWGPVWSEKVGGWWCWVSSRSGWLLELLTELIKGVYFFHNPNNFNFKLLFWLYVISRRYRIYSIFNPQLTFKFRRKKKVVQAARIGLEWMGLDWSSLHWSPSVPIRYSISIVWQVFESGWMVTSSNVSGCRKSVQWGDRQQSGPSCLKPNLVPCERM